jgi:hypothetical protein
MEMDDILKAKLILQENIKEENEKLREEREKEKEEKEVILNERMSLNTVRNLSLIDRARLKVLKQNINLTKKRLNTNQSNRESIKKTNEIFFTMPNLPNNNLNNEEDDENVYENFMRNKIEEYKKERDDKLKIVEKARKEMHKSFNKDYITNLWLKNKKTKNPSFNILSSLFTDLTKISIQERKKLKAFEKKKELTLPPILMHQFYKPVKIKVKNKNSKTVNERKNSSVDLFTQVSLIVDNFNHKNVDESTQI